MNPAPKRSDVKPDITGGPQRTPTLAQAMNLDTWIVMPAYDEGKNLKENIDALLPNFFNLVVVYDGSVDKEFDPAGKQGINALRLKKKRGQGAALRTGIEFALQQGAKIIVTLDPDGEHAAPDIEKLVEPIRKGKVDVVLGSRFLDANPKLSFRRKMALGASVFFTRYFSDMEVTDTHHYQRAFNRQAAEAISITLNGMAHASEILHQIEPAGLRYLEIPAARSISQELMNKGHSVASMMAIVKNGLLTRIKPRKAKGRAKPVEEEASRPLNENADDEETPERVEKSEITRP